MDCRKNSVSWKPRQTQGDEIATHDVSANGIKYLQMTTSADLVILDVHTPSSLKSRGKPPEIEIQLIGEGGGT